MIWNFKHRHIHTHQWVINSWPFVAETAGRAQSWYLGLWTNYRYPSISKHSNQTFRYDIGLLEIHSWSKLLFSCLKLRNLTSSGKYCAFPSESESVSCSVLSSFLQLHGLEPVRLLCPWNSPGKNTEVGCHSLLQGIFSTQGSNLRLPHCRQILYLLSHQGSHLN